MASFPAAGLRRPGIARDALLALLTVLLYWAVEAVAEAIYYWPVAGASAWGGQSALAQTAISVAAILIGLLLVGRVDRLSKAVAWSFLVGTFVIPAAWSYYAFGPEPGTDTARTLVYVATLLPPAVPLIWLARGAGRTRWIGLVPAVTFVGALTLSSQVFYYEPLIYGAEDQGNGYTPVDVEALYSAQRSLLDAEIAKLAPERPGQTDMFALLLGGTASQSVFLNEVEAVQPILAANYGAGERIVHLANSREAPLRYPLANKPNLEYALSALHDRMGPEDVAFLFLTSHGSEDLFSLSFYEAGTKNLTAADFAAMLKRTGIGPAVIVLSACHSGSFLDEIAAPDRLVIAAARADRSSFGCANGRDWTEFGRYFFDQALRGEPDPRLAFAKALPAIRWKEFWTLRRASLPQISEGADIGAVLDRLLVERRKLAAR
jgi:hypothetical protein